MAAPLRSREIKGSDPDSNPDSLTRALLKRNSLHFDLSHNLPRIRNILLFHGDADETVPFSNALEIREKAENPKRLIRFEAGDHRMSNPVHQAIFIQEATEWFVQTAGSLS